MVHEHNLLHEAAVLKKGRKYVIRTGTSCSKILPLPATAT